MHSNQKMHKMRYVKYNVYVKFKKKVLLVLKFFYIFNKFQ